MALSCVYLAADVYMVCLQHALSTEKEEVMGLLIGEVRIVKFTTYRIFFSFCGSFRPISCDIIYHA